MKNIIDYLEKLKEADIKIAVYADNDPKRLIGKIAYILEDAVVLAASDDYKEIAVMLKNVVSVKEWAE